MKLTNILLAVAITATISFAETPKEMNSKTMIRMESDLASIQKGFLYNNIELVKYGAEQISKEIIIYHDRDTIKAILPKGKQQMENAAIITSNRIDTAISELKLYTELKDMRQAHHSFLHVIEACTDCHNIVRGW